MKVVDRRRVPAPIRSSKLEARSSKLEAEKDWCSFLQMWYPSNRNRSSTCSTRNMKFKSRRLSLDCCGVYWFALAGIWFCAVCWSCQQRFIKRRLSLSFHALVDRRFQQVDESKVPVFCSPVCGTVPLVYFVSFVSIGTTAVVKQNVLMESRCGYESELHLNFAAVRTRLGTEMTSADWNWPRSDCSVSNQALSRQADLMLFPTFPTLPTLPTFVASCQLLDGFTGEVWHWWAVAYF